jgi:hypothetical protein
MAITGHRGCSGYKTGDAFQPPDNTDVGVSNIPPNVQENFVVLLGPRNTCAVGMLVLAMSLLIDQQPVGQQPILRMGPRPEGITVDADAVKDKQTEAQPS